MTTGLVEGADDPGRIYSKKQNVHAILSVLSLLTLKGCAEDNDVPSSPAVGLLVFTLVFGFCCIAFWMMVNGLQQNRQAQNEPDAEPTVSENFETESMENAAVTASAADATSAMPSSSSAADTVLTAENYVRWLLTRCARRRDQTNDADRRRLYEERVTILLGLQSALTSPHASFRSSARRALGSMSDISDDESSPNYARINGPANLGETQRALSFIASPQSGSASSTGFSTNVDMVANALGRNMNFPPPTSESGADETRSEAMERYMSSRRSDVSDPSLWNYLHHGDEIPDESESNESNAT